MEQERRQHRRLAIQLPVEWTFEREGVGKTMRAMTGNISTGGLYFELDLMEGVVEPQVNDVLQLVLTVPPGDGYSPYQGQVSSIGRLVRRVAVPGDSANSGEAKLHMSRVGFGVRFQEPLKLAF